MEMKRLAAPKFWKIRRKESKFVICPKPGPHPKEESIPLGVLLRDYLGICQTQKEISQVLQKGLVSVNGIVRKQRRLPVGTMDIISLSDTTYRLVPGKKGIEPKQVSDGSIRLCKVMNKKTLKGGKIQINLSAGENMKIDKNAYSTGDVLVMDVVTKTVKEVLKLEAGSMVLITGGKNMGDLGIVESIEVIKNPLPTLVTLKLGERSVKVPKDYVFVVGKNKPVIEM